MPWNPTTITRADRAYNTATEAVRVMTDSGAGFLKALGNQGGPHLLAAEFVGTQLARWIGLPTFDFALIEVMKDDEIAMYKGGHAEPGLAFITREQSGFTWGGDTKTMESVVNPADMSRLVLFDTWTRNCDRHPPDLTIRKPNYSNVFLSDEGLVDGKLRLIAMDHTHCFQCGRDLTESLARIDFVKDDRLHGMFPAFRPYLDAHRAAVEKDLVRLATVRRSELDEIVSAVPKEWQVEATARTALVDFLHHRGVFLASISCKWRILRYN